jgi:dTDP-4-amino-4,6-dideoxy-D-glucose acyltransferase
MYNRAAGHGDSGESRRHSAAARAISVLALFPLFRHAGRGEEGKRMSLTNYSPEELAGMGIRFGENVQVHRSVQFFGENVILGSNVRIDCQCLISSKAPVVIGNHVHLAFAVYIIGSAGVLIDDYCGLASRCSIFTVSDDYSDGHLTNPTIPDKYRNVRSQPVTLEKHAIVGSGSVIMPGVTICRGAAVGALSFVNKRVPPYFIVSGSPLRKIGVRNRERLEALEAQYEAERSRGEDQGRH